MFNCQSANCGLCHKGMYDLLVGHYMEDFHKTASVEAAESVHALSDDPLRCSICNMSVQEMLRRHYQEKHNVDSLQSIKKLERLGNPDAGSKATKFAVPTAPKTSETNAKPQQRVIFQERENGTKVSPETEETKKSQPQQQQAKFETNTTGYKAPTKPFVPPLPQIEKDEQKFESDANDMDLMVVDDVEPAGFEQEETKMEGSSKQNDAKTDENCEPGATSKDGEEENEAATSKADEKEPVREAEPVNFTEGETFPNWKAFQDKFDMYCEQEFFYTTTDQSGKRLPPEGKGHWSEDWCPSPWKHKTLKCIHMTNKKPSKSKGERKNQHVNDTGCPFVLRVLYDDNKELYRITKFHCEHIGHERDKNYCGTKKCRDIRDCKDVGHVISAVILGKTVPTKCYKGRCSYT